MTRRHLVLGSTYTISHVHIKNTRVCPNPTMSATLHRQSSGALDIDTARYSYVLLRWYMIKYEHRTGQWAHNKFTCAQTDYLVWVYSGEGSSPSTYATLPYYEPAWCGVSRRAGSNILLSC